MFKMGRKKLNENKNSSFATNILLFFLYFYLFLPIRSFALNFWFIFEFSQFFALAFHMSLSEKIVCLNFPYI